MGHVWLVHCGWYAHPATLTELRLHSPGLRAWPATLGNAPTNIATLYELRLAVGVILSWIIPLHIGSDGFALG